MQLGSLASRLTPGQKRRRAAKLARRKAAGHKPNPFDTLFVRPKVKRRHYTFKDLREKAYRRGLAVIQAGQKPLVVRLDPEKPKTALHFAESFTDRARRWRDSVKRVLFHRRAQ